MPSIICTRRSSWAHRPGRGVGGTSLHPTQLVSVGQNARDSRLALTREQAGQVRNYLFVRNQHAVGLVSVRLVERPPFFKLLNEALQACKRLRGEHEAQLGTFGD